MAKSKCGKDDGSGISLDSDFVRWSSTGKRLEDEEAVELMAAVIKQAARDYRESVRWLTKHENQSETKKYHIVEKLRDDVISFSKSKMFLLVFDGVLDSEKFLQMSVQEQI